MYGPIYDLVTGRRDKVEEYVVDDVNDWLLENMSIELMLRAIRCLIMEMLIILVRKDVRIYLI